MLDGWMCVDAVCWMLDARHNYAQLPVERGRRQGRGGTVKAHDGETLEKKLLLKITQHSHTQTAGKHTNTHTHTE